MNFAENLKSIRKEQKLSQEELAEMLDVSRQWYTKPQTIHMRALYYFA